MPDFDNPDVADSPDMLDEEKVLDPADKQEEDEQDGGKEAGIEMPPHVVHVRPGD